MPEIYLSLGSNLGNRKFFIDKAEKLVGQELGISEYLTVTQDQINKFADATLDHQWIHPDFPTARAPD